MKTTFLLHGGMTRCKDERNDTFFQRVTEGLADGDTVLWIGLARRDREERERILQRDTDMILAHTSKAIEVAKAELGTLDEQAAAAHAIFITGGNTEGLVSDISQKDSFLEAIKGKVVAGSSAGAYLFAAYYFACQDAAIRPGLGVLPLRIMAHYGNPAFNATAENLNWFKENTPSDLELLVLPECEWRVMVKEL